MDGYIVHNMSRFQSNILGSEGLSLKVKPKESTEDWRRIPRVDGLDCGANVPEEKNPATYFQGAIASDSVGPLEPVAVISGQSTSQVYFNLLK